MMRRVMTLALVAAVTVSACKKHRVAPAPPRSTGAEPFRKTAPSAAAPRPWAPPPIVAAKLGNGVRVLLVERHDLPVIALQVLVDRGADQGSPGAGAFLGAMLLQGTKTRSAIEISDDFGKLGAQYGAWGGLDSVGINAKVLASAFPEALAIVADCLRNPAFDDAEIERERKKRLTAIAQQKDSPATLLRNAVSEVLYPDTHPYHGSLLGTEETVTAITSSYLVALHAKLVEPEDLTVAISGDITKEAALAELEKRFGDWKGTPDPPFVADLPEDDGKGARIVLIDRPGATQSHMAAALIGVPRSNKDYYALMVMNTILGGQFSSRLNMNLREKHAYTYGARSSFEMRHGAGPFTAGGAIVREKTEPAAEEILAELQRMTTEEVDDEELGNAKDNLIRQLPASFETVSDVAGSLAYLAIYGLPLDEFATRAQAYAAITKADVLRVAKAYLRSDRLRIVIVGDAAIVEKDLAKLGMGEIDVRRAAK